MNNKFDWVKDMEKKQEEDRSKDYFNIQEGTNKFFLLSHCAPLAQVYEGGKYRIAEEGDTNVSVKGLCWVLQDDVIKSAKLPYTIVKQIRALTEDPEWDFELPFEHQLTLTAKNAGTKEVEYSLVASPKKTPIPENILEELKKKPTPEELIEKIKAKVSPSNKQNAPYIPYDGDTPPPFTDEELDANGIPF